MWQLMFVTGVEARNNDLGCSLNSMLEAIEFPEIVEQPIEMSGFGGLHSPLAT